MSSPCCPTCQRPYPKPRAFKAEKLEACGRHHPDPCPSDCLIGQQIAKRGRPAVKVPVDTAALNLDELRAFYKRIGTREDCRFWLKHALYVPADIRSQGEALIAALETRDGRPADAKRLAELKRLALPYYRQVCGHTHHTSVETATACRLGMLGQAPRENDRYVLDNDRADVVLEVLGWAPIPVESTDSNQVEP